MPPLRIIYLFNLLAYRLIINNIDRILFILLYQLTIVNEDVILFYLSRGSYYEHRQTVLLYI